MANRMSYVAITVVSTIMASFHVGVDSSYGEDAFGDRAIDSEV